MHHRLNGHEWAGETAKDREAWRAAGSPRGRKESSEQQRGLEFRFYPNSLSFQLLGESCTNSFVFKTGHEGFPFHGRSSPLTHAWFKGQMTYLTWLFQLNVLNLVSSNAAYWVILTPSAKLGSRPGCRDGERPIGLGACGTKEPCDESHLQEGGRGHLHVAWAAPLAPRPPPGVLQAPGQRARPGCLGDRRAHPAHLASPAPAHPPASVVPPGEDMRLSTWNLERCVAVKRISPEMTETRVRSSASAGNQCSTAPTVLMLS